MAKTCTQVDLEELAGRHVLNTAPVWTTKKHDYNDEADVMAIGIDGDTYVFTENPCDGYRSYLDGVEKYTGLDRDFLSGAAPVNREVLIVYDDGKKSGWRGDSDDLIHIHDIETGHQWGTLGTRNVGDYYPSCTMQWTPLDPDIPIKPAKPIGIKAAEAIAEVYGYDQVIIYGRQIGEGGIESMITHGIDPNQSELTRILMGEKLRQFMGWEY